LSWSLVQKKAIDEDGNLLFPERLTHEYLDSALKEMGTWKFANQYQNEIVPDGETPFKKEWIRYWKDLPTKTNVFAFIDPAISQADSADYTACVVVALDENLNWYVLSAQRYKIDPTKIVELVFRVYDEFKPTVIGVEDVAYQKALLYMMSDEMKRRGKNIPVMGINPGTTKSKETRIMGLVPLFEFNRIYLKKGMTDLELEYGQFPRGAHDDVLDALASINFIATAPSKPYVAARTPHIGSPEYEGWRIKQLRAGRKEGRQDWNDEDEV